MRFQQNSCCCGTEDAQESLFAARDLNFGATTEQSAIVRCTRCGSIFPTSSPAPDSIGEAYRGYYTAPRTVRRKGIIKALLNLTRRDYMNRSLPRGNIRLLDFGCGNGDYLREARARLRSASCFGTDAVHPGDRAVKHFTWVPLDRLSDCPKGYDWITASHVVEHLPDPISTLGVLTHLLNPGGAIWISTPNAESFLITAFGARARDIDFPRHRLVFSRNLLVSLLGKAGLAVTEHNPPRLNAVLNFTSCAKNVVRDKSLSRGEKVALLAKGTVHLALHLVKFGSRRKAESPELVLIAAR